MVNLKSSQIRIGNYIKSGIIGRVISIGSEEQEFEQVYCECLESFEWFFRDNYSGIKLTSDWLLGFGFVMVGLSKKGNEIWRKDFSDGYFELEHIINYHFGHTLYSVACLYVHQLQNLYFCITGEELDIKWEVIESI